MNIGLIDVENYDHIDGCFPNLVLMKLSAWHKAQGDSVEFCRSLNYNPYITIYNKDALPKGHELRKFQRFVNNKFVFWSCQDWQNYKFI